MRYLALGCLVGFSLAATAIHHGNPQFFTRKNYEALHRDLAPRGLLPRFELEPSTAPRGTFCHGALCQDKGAAL